MRICCGGKRGCKKKYCCPGLVLFVIFCDLFGLTMLIMAIVGFVQFDRTFFYNDHDKYVEYGHIMKTVFVVFLPMQILFVVKLYLGGAWFFCKKQSRRSFVKFYRISMTFNFSVFAIDMELLLLSLGIDKDVWNVLEIS